MKWLHGPGEGMTRKRRSTGSLRGRRLIKSWPSIIPKNQIVAIVGLALFTKVVGRVDMRRAFGKNNSFL
jgi:hypothetical protein